MDEELIILVSGSVRCSDTIEDSFKKVLELYWTNCHIINRRLMATLKLEDSDEKRLVLDKCEFDFLAIDVCKFVPKSSMFSKQSYEVRCINGPFSAIYFPITFDELRSPHIPIPYQLSLNINENSTYFLTISFPQKHQSHPICSWLTKQAFPRLLKWMNQAPTHAGLYSHALIDSACYAETYERIKETSGKELVKNWTEKTDPQKFVFEDCAIASYLIELWRNNHGYPNQFVDMGCGNGLLVYLLANEKINGIGVDVRKRNIWANFRNVADLREIVLDPSSVYTGLPDGTDFLIGNHSDELTPWIPIIAARLKCRFFLLPCCPFDLFGKFSKRGSNCIPFAEDLGKFGQYFTYIHSIITKLGFDVKLDRLKIPSTKRLCFVGSLPENGLPENIEERILEIINAAKNVNKEFIPRLKVEQVRNCSLLPTDLRTNLTKKIFDYLLNLSLERIGDWRCGGSEKLVDIIKTLTGEEKEHLRQQNGGLQTFIKNQHQVFTVRNGSVGIRKWPLENGEFLSKQKDIRKSECWFFRNHPDGCPVSTEKCAFRH